MPTPVTWSGGPGKISPDINSCRTPSDFKLLGYYKDEQNRAMRYGPGIKD